MFGFLKELGGEMRVERVGRDHFARLAEDCGVSPKLVLSRLDALASASRPAAQKVAGDLSVECPSEVYGEIEKAIDRHLEQVHA